MCCGLETCRSDGALACSSSCTPFAGGCPDGFGCEILSDGLLEFSDCRVAGTGVQGTSCAGSADCAPGFLCVLGSAPSCHRYCSTDDAAHGCDVGTSCHMWSILDGVIYGICY